MDFSGKGSEVSPLSCIILIKFHSKFVFSNSSLGSLNITAVNVKGSTIGSSLSIIAWVWVWVCALMKLHLFDVFSYLEFTFSTNCAVFWEMKYPSR